MKILKTLLVVIIALVVLATIIGFFMPSKMQVERSIEINAPVAAIFEQVNTLKNWERWSPWHKMDTNMIISYNEISTGKGASYTWKSEDRGLGNGTLTITESIPDLLIKNEMNFDSGSGTAEYQFQTIANGTKVIWIMDSDVGGNPFMRLMVPMMNKKLGQIFEQGLKDLKGISEKK